jgi:hypothetical protein
VLGGAGVDWFVQVAGGLVCWLVLVRSGLDSGVWAPHGLTRANVGTDVGFRVT